MSGCVVVRVNYPHVLHVVQARLEREGFTQDTPERRRLIQLRAGPRPVGAHNMEDEASWPTH